MIRNLCIILFFINLSFLKAQVENDYYKIIDQFRRYDLDSTSNYISNLKKSISKDIFQLELGYQTLGKINKIDIENLNRKSKEHYLDSVLYYNFVGDFYIRKSIKDSIDYVDSFNSHIKALNISKRNNDSILILESLRRVNYHFIINYLDVKLYENYVSEIKIYSKNDVDFFWSKYYDNMFQMTFSAIDDDQLKIYKKRFSDHDFNRLKKAFNELVLLAKNNDYLKGLALYSKTMLLLENEETLNQAEKTLEEAIKYYNLNDLFYSQIRRSKANTLLANCKFKKGLYNEAIVLLHNVLKSNCNKIDIGFKKAIYSNLLKIYEIQEKKDSINYYYRLYNELEKEERQELTAIQIRRIYEKNNDLEYQQELKNKEKKIMNQSTILSIVLPILAIIALIAIALFYYFKKYKSKSKTLESAQSETLEKIEELKKIVIKNHIVLKDKTKVYISDLMYIKSEDHYLRIYTNDTKNAFVRGKLSQIKEELPPNFIQSHRSYIINSNFIKQINNNHIILLDKTEIPLSRSHKNNFKDKT